MLGDCFCTRDVPVDFDGQDTAVPVECSCRRTGIFLENVPCGWCVRIRAASTKSLMVLTST